MDKKLFLLDAYALIYRSYYAFIKNPRINSKGLNTSAVFGFVLTLEELLRKEKPSHIAIVFDPPTPTFRHVHFPEYKAQRPPMPDDLRTSIPYIREVIKAFNISQLEKDGFEADDVIGTLSKKAEKEGFDVFMMTPDKDFAQLVSDKVRMYKPRRSGQDVEILGKEEICEKFKITDPEQVIDILALWGDSADNIPGAPGIGEKGAKEIIGNYGSISGIYDHIEEFKGKRKENLINFREQIEQARYLVTIDTAVDIDFDSAQLETVDPDFEKLKELFDELEFATMANRIIAGYGKPATPQAVSKPASTAIQGDLFGSASVVIEEQDSLPGIDSVDHQYHLLDDDIEIIKLTKKLLQQKEYCFDTETTGLDALDAELVGLAISFTEHEAYYIPFSSDPAALQSRLELLRPALEDASILKIAQNLKYDIQILANYSVKVSGPFFDTMLAHYLLEADSRHNLDLLARKYLSYSMVPISKLIGEKGKNQKSMRDIPLNEIKEYAGEDADITLQLKNLFDPLLEEKELYPLFNDIEMPLVQVLADMEREGMLMNTGSLEQFSIDLKNDLIKIEEEILSLAGVQFNVGSPKQLGEVLFDHLKIDPNAKRTKSKQYSTSEDTLSRLSGRHPIIAMILEFRGLRKLLNTYVDTLPGLVRPKTGKIHSSFNQAVAATGRLSSINPNLQNIPIREERGREIRKAFVPSSEEYIFLSADYSQVELRLMAHMSSDKNMIAAFNRNEDIHTATAALINNISPDDVSKEMRSRAKTANFGIIYGISSFGLAQRLNISRREAKSLIDGYFKSYPGVKTYMDMSIQSARDSGYVKTLMGRRRYLPDIQSQNPMVRGNAERNAINAPVQGSAADLIKLAMIRIHQELLSSGLKSRMILQVHDELNFDVYKPEISKVRDIVRHEMEHVIQLQVPLIVDIGTGTSWFEAH
ncbi:MAG: DNA polymerase I [Bacteroidetes bacterium]|nr:DNA polymerase I [Bacteroidota bacterium]